MSEVLFIIYIKWPTARLVELRSVLSLRKAWLYALIVMYSEKPTVLSDDFCQISCYIVGKGRKLPCIESKNEKQEQNIWKLTNKNFKTKSIFGKYNAFLCGFRQRQTAD